MTRRTTAQATAGVSTAEAESTSHGSVRSRRWPRTSARAGSAGNRATSGPSAGVQESRSSSSTRAWERATRERPPSSGWSATPTRALAVLRGDLCTRSSGSSPPWPSRALAFLRDDLRRSCSGSSPREESPARSKRMPRLRNSPTATTRVLPSPSRGRRRDRVPRPPPLEASSIRTRSRRWASRMT